MTKKSYIDGGEQRQIHITSPIELSLFKIWAHSRVTTFEDNCWSIRCIWVSGAVYIPVSALGVEMPKGNRRKDEMSLVCRAEIMYSIPYKTIV